MAKRKRSTPRNRDNERGPHYSPEILAEIQWFLAAYLVEAEAGYEQAVAALKLFPQLEKYQGDIVYFKNCVSCIKWLMQRSALRQKHLLLRQQGEIVSK